MSFASVGCKTEAAGELAKRLCVVRRGVLVFGASATAVAKRAPIAGKLSEPGYTVIALAPP